MSKSSVYNVKMSGRIIGLRTVRWLYQSRIITHLLVSVRGACELAMRGLSLVTQVMPIHGARHSFRAASKHDYAI
jgi:hypothetical protein